MSQRCSGHSTRDGRPCGRWANRGGTVCTSHGGAAPQVRAANRRTVEAATAAKAIATYGLPVDIDPHDALMEEIARTAGHVRWLAGVVQAMDSEALVWGKTGTEQRRGGPGGDYALLSSTAQPSVWVSLYQAERTHLVAVCRAAIGAGIAERQVRLAEAQGALIAAVIRSMIEDPELGLGPDQQEVARKVASRHLRVLPAA